ncbi:hypothetical protein CLHOM_32210 [Clostridium homopropionicum DSM 5847]|uniref:Uncharacterized protein n=1 Tax=Clostridium homopropionicum DSM 5847 TaxID=1121318 RepID=A0A0L6Z5T2_9CLOT|nr:hypothetical protein [Clostridium homopropionicum]KOA18324.1 hypothetical protein CLHOM_32210 [Clostridium homopropionicum DSM 5847]SFF69156.1 hypothetical protein SAMN04488501_101262 [Clostridium homopropionicum]
MAKLSQTVTSIGIPDESKKQLATCFFCGQEIKKGGCWAGEFHIGVCKKCSPYLIDLLVDTLEDSDIEFKTASIQEKLKNIEEISKTRLEKKELNKKVNEKYENIKK